MNYTLYFFVECAIIATDVAEVIGTAIALNVLIKVPAGVAITVVNVFAIMFTYNPGNFSTKFIRAFEYFVAVLVLGVAICFAVELSYIPKTTSDPALSNQDSLDYDVSHGNYSILDDNLEGKKTQEEIIYQDYANYPPTLSAIKYCIRYSMIELALNLFTFALFINCSIMVVAGAALYGSEEAADVDLYTIHDLLSKTLAPAAGTIFMLALLLSGKSAGIVCTIAGQIVSEGHIKRKLLPWQRRLVTRAIPMLPCLVISICSGRGPLSKAFNASQVVLPILLPF